MDHISSLECGLTVERYAKAKQLSQSKMGRWHVSTEPNPYRRTEGPVFDALGPQGTPCVAFRYLDRDGQLVRIKYRGQRGTAWDQQSGVPTTLYGLWFIP